MCLLAEVSFIISKDSYIYREQYKMYVLFINIDIFVCLDWSSSLRGTG